MDRSSRRRDLAVVISLERDRPERGPSLQSLQDFVQDDLLGVNTEILARMQSRVGLIPELAGHLISSGGKRLRPMLTLAAAKLCGYEGDRHIKLAACVEFIHTATLLHDDVVDGSELRRGSPTANALWGNEASVLVGDFLFSRSFQIMVEDGSLAVLAILSNASAVIAEGEVAQLLTANNTTTSEETYLEVITAKTAALFSAACRIGSLLTERPGAEEEALESFGKNIGITYQLVDDALDYTAHQATLGKTVGDDFREGKITLPVLLAFRRGDDKERAFWRRTLQHGEIGDGDLEQAVSLMEIHEALHDTIERSRHYGSIARDSLGLFPDCAAKKALLDTVDFCITRDH